MRKDNLIGKRAAEEVNRLCAERDMNCAAFSLEIFGNKRKVSCDMEHWRNRGTTPSTCVLQGLCIAGADINYILTGRRTDRQ